MILNPKNTRELIRKDYLCDEGRALERLIKNSTLSVTDRETISAQAAELVNRVRNHSHPSMMEKFLAEYGLTTKEGVALMCLAEALLRVPDSITIDALIEDKVATGNWKEHLGKSPSSLVNSSTWALLVTGKLLKDSEEKHFGATVKSLIKRLGEPVIRTAVAQAMKELGRQFVLGRTIKEATENARSMEKRGYTYSYDMLGEAARTDQDALRYHKAYSDAISELAKVCNSTDIRKNPGISVKLSALHPRYEVPQRERVINELVPRTLSLALQAKEANMGFNIDAEEADRLDLSLDVIYKILSDPRLEGWDGLGVVVQAYGQRCAHVLDWLYATAKELDRKIMVRLVKGAYWDAEIKRAQTMGLNGFPVYTRKVHSDLSYISCAEKLLKMTDQIYAQFATHNAHSVSAIRFMAAKFNVDHFEFQRLHGMGESLHDTVLSADKTRCRIYAPVGAHRDLLAYLVRRLLENGANSSFVNQIVDKSIPASFIAKDPFKEVEKENGQFINTKIAQPSLLFGHKRRNAKGWDITDPVELERLLSARTIYQKQQWNAFPMLAIDVDSGQNMQHPIINPADPKDIVGFYREASPLEIKSAIENAKTAFTSWSSTTPAHRSDCLKRVADLFEEHADELFALICREAGKSHLDVIGEVREAVDFARFYANEAENETLGKARGIMTCISPWNFPLAIFSGQILACLAGGNVVLAKPADQTPLIAAKAVALMHEAGIPSDALQLLPGSGANVGALLTSHPDINGVCFTGSTLTAQTINKAMAQHMAPDAPFVAETGGMNAMIVDSTALPEQVVRDVLISSFQSAGQRCSALRVLYLQEDIADHLLEMLYGAMDELVIGNPLHISTDIGPVIDQAAQEKILSHISSYRLAGRVLKELKAPQTGTFVAPTVLKIDGIEELKEEIFGPVLHIATFKATDLDKVVNDINAKGYGLTFGLHTRVDNRVTQVVNAIRVGNIYVNRNQIGAVVGSQPFGGEGLSGTGPKAGGPHYVKRFTKPTEPMPTALKSGKDIPLLNADQVQELINRVQDLAVVDVEKHSDLLFAFFDQKLDHIRLNRLNSHEMPGPTGELNVLSEIARGTILCLGPTREIALQQACSALMKGNKVVLIADNIDDVLEDAKTYHIPLVGYNGAIESACLTQLSGFNAVCANTPEDDLRLIRKSLAEREGALLPLITEGLEKERFVMERHLCIDTTAAGGNANLIATAE